MSEFRHRRADAPAVPAPGQPGARDAPGQRRGPDAGFTMADTRSARDTVPGYDALAQYKRPVAKPEGYLPDDTGGSGPIQTLLRWRGDRGVERDPTDAPALTRSDRRADMPPAGAGDGQRRDSRLRGEVDGDRADVLRAVIDRPDFRDPTDARSPDRYADPLARPDGTRVPCFDGPPRREQTRQGWAGDCGIIATLGAVAAHLPEEIERRIRPREDGSYQVTLSEARRSGGVAEPTGRDIELTVTPEVPVHNRDTSSPACAKIQDGAGWCAVMEKAFAGLDQTWTAGRRASWEHDWAGLCANDQARNVGTPRSGPAPDGYVRLHQGTTPWERAEALTQLTGQPAVVREFPADRDEWQINQLIRTQLTDGKPVLVSSREKMHEHERLPHHLEPGHVYEVIQIEKGKLVLRNPWNRDHPRPMETEEFARNMSPYYSTLM